MATAKNDITGSEIKSVPTEKYRANYDAIFKKANVAGPDAATDKPATPTLKLSRIDYIGQNGNDGYEP